MGQAYSVLRQGFQAGGSCLEGPGLNVVNERKVPNTVDELRDFANMVFEEGRKDRGQEVLELLLLLKQCHMHDIQDEFLNRAVDDCLSRYGITLKTVVFKKGQLVRRKKAFLSDNWWASKGMGESPCTVKDDALAGEGSIQLMNDGFCAGEITAFTAVEERT